MSIKGRCRHRESDWRWAFAFPELLLLLSHVIHSSRSVELFTSPNRLNNNKSFPYLVTSSKTNDLIWWFIDFISPWVWVSATSLSLRHSSLNQPPMTVVPHKKKNKNNNDNNNKHLKIPPPGTGIVSEPLFASQWHCHALSNIFTDFLIYSRRHSNSSPRGQSSSTTIFANWVTNLGWTNDHHHLLRKRGQDRFNLYTGVIIVIIVGICLAQSGRLLDCGWIGD